MKALITGITGQDGAYLARLLLSKGYSVDGFSPIRSSPNKWRLQFLGVEDKVNYLSGDITCSASVSSVIEQGQYDEVYNLAAQSFVGESFNSPLSTFNVNTIGVLNLLESIRRQSIHTKLYQASTSEMFGNAKTSPQNEDTPFNPVSPYAVSKLAAHYSAINYRESYGLKACCGILFNHESPIRGIEFVTRKITDGIAQILAGKKEKLVLGNLDSFRDWGHASDYVNAMWMMLQQDELTEYVIATGESYSIKEFLDFTLYLSGLSRAVVDYDKKYKRPSDVRILTGDHLRATADLGWHAETSLQSMIKEMLIEDCIRNNVLEAKIEKIRNARIYR